MFTPLAALILSGTLAVTSLAPTSAQASDSDAIAKLLLGALVLYGVKEAVDNRNDRRRSTPRAVVKEPEFPRHSGVITPHSPNTPRYGNHSSNFLPINCILTHRTGYNDTRIRPWNFQATRPRADGQLYRYASYISLASSMAGTSLRFL